MKNAHRNSYMKRILSILCIAVAGFVHAAPTNDPLGINKSTKELNEIAVKVPSGSTITYKSGSTLSILSGATVTAASGSVINLGNCTLTLPAIFAADAGSTDSYSVTFSPALASYTTGMGYRFKANTANTGAATLNINGLGPKALKKAAGGITTDVATNDILAGQWVDVVYDGTNFQMQSLLGNAPAGGGGGGGDLYSTNNLSDLANKATARANLGVAIGTDVQAYAVNLTTLAGYTPANIFRYGLTQTFGTTSTVWDWSSGGTLTIKDSGTGTAVLQIINGGRLSLGAGGGLEINSALPITTNGAALTAHSIWATGAAGLFAPIDPGTSGWLLVSGGSGANAAFRAGAAADVALGNVPNVDATNAANIGSGTLSAARMPALTGDITTTVNTVATTIANSAVTNAKIANSTIDLTTKVTGSLPVANGGTGLASFAVGDLPYASGTTAISALADVSAGSYLRSGGTTTPPLWSTLKLPNSGTTGDLLYVSATNIGGNLADVATGSVLVSGGIGSIPGWSNTPALGIPSAIVLTNGTGLPLSGLNGLATGGSTFLSTPSSANLRSFLTDEVGTGAALFAGAGDSNLALAVKPAVAVVAVANLTLSGEQIIDGVTTSGSLVLATAQSTGSQNGPWVSTAGAWARPGWYASGSTVQAPQFLVTSPTRLGTAYGGSSWKMTTASVTIDTTATTWTQIPTNVNSTTGTLAAANGGTALDTSGSTGVPHVSSGTWSVNSAATEKTFLSLNNVENTALSTWAGSSNITTLGTLGVLATSGAITLSGTGGASYICLPYQSAAPTTPGASKALIYANAVGQPTWMQPDGFAVGIQTFSRRRTVDMYTECMSTAQQDGFANVSAGTGAVATGMASPVAGHPGIRTLITGTTTTGSANYMAPTAFNAFILGGGAGVYEACVDVVTLSDGTDTFTVRLGVVNSSTGEPTDGVYVRYTNGNVSGHWQGVCRAAGTESTADLTDAVTAGQWDTLRFEVNAAATSVTFYVNGVSRGTITTNIPTSVAEGISAGVVKSAGTTSRTLNVDFISWHQDLTTLR